MQVWKVLHAARCKFGTQKSPKNRHLGTITQLCRAMSSQLRQASTIGKNLLNSSISPTSSQYGELQPTSGWDLLASLGHPTTFQQVSRLGSVTARHSSSGRQPNCGIEQRAPPIFEFMFSRAAITLGTGPHCSCFCLANATIASMLTSVNSMDSK